LSVTQKTQVESLTGMGFPPARAARAVLRYDDDTKVLCIHTTLLIITYCFQVLDFLFAVGQLEEKKYSGDSAETALISCKEDVAKVRKRKKCFDLPDLNHCLFVSTGYRVFGQSGTV